MKKLFSLLLALPLLFVACETENEATNEPQTNDATLELTSNGSLSFEAKGGNGEITYTLKGEDETSFEISSVSPVTATTEAAWITILEQESVFGAIKFEVAENTATEQRSSSIKVSYLTQSFSVTVNQAAAEPVREIEGWAIIGSMTNNWNINNAILMEDIEGYFVARGVELATSDSFKFIKDGSMQNGLGGNGQAAERDYKYATSKYGSDIRVKEAGTYDIYINDALTSYYIMGEGNNPDNAYEVIAPGEDAWFVTGIGESQRMRKSGIFLYASGISINENGFKLYHGLSDKSYGAVEDAVAELSQEIAIVADSEYKIKANVEENRLYDIYLHVEEGKVWVMPRSSKPDYIHECNYAEGVWFDGYNFVVMLKSENLRLTIDCNSAKANTNAIIPAATYSVGGEDGYVINVSDSEIANEDGKQNIVSGSVTISHIEGGYDISVDLVNAVQHRVRAHFCGEVASNQYMGGYVTNPTGIN